MKVQLISPLEPSDPFLAELARLESRLPAAERPWLRAVRRRALARFGERGFPGRRDEDWKYTDVSTIAERPLRVALPGVGPWERAPPASRPAASKQGNGAMPGWNAWNWCS